MKHDARTVLDGRNNDKKSSRTRVRLDIEGVRLHQVVKRQPPFIDGGLLPPGSNIVAQVHVQASSNK